MEQFEDLTKDNTLINNNTFAQEETNITKILFLVLIKKNFDIL